MEFFFDLILAAPPWPCDSLRAGRSGGDEIFRTRPDRPWGPPSLLYNGYRVFFSGVKRPGRGVNHPSPSSADVKERVELYLYSPAGPSWPLLGRTLPLLECKPTIKSGIPLSQNRKTTTRLHTDEQVQIYKSEDELQKAAIALN